MIVEESSIYMKDEYVTYKSPASLGISVLTDTTERSPTFNLSAFESQNSDPQSLCYLSIEGTVSLN